MRASRGLTLVEVLVTLVILAVGLLGLSGLIVKASGLNYEAYQRQQALAIASDMAERMHANQSPSAANLVTAGIYANSAPLTAPLGGALSAGMWSALGSSVLDCGNLAAAAFCTPAQIAQYDLALWEGQLLGAGKRSTGAAGNAGVGGLSNARGCIEGPPAVTLLSKNVAAPANTFRITVAWQGEQPVPVSASADQDLRNVAACARGGYATREGVADSSDLYRRLVVLYQVIN